MTISETCFLKQYIKQSAPCLTLKQGKIQRSINENSSQRTRQRVFWLSEKTTQKAEIYQVRWETILLLD